MLKHAAIHAQECPFAQIILVSLFCIHHKNPIAARSAAFIGMRPSNRKTVMAALRVRIDELSREAGRRGFGQKQMAELVGKSLATIQSLETGRLALSADLANIVSLKTGANLKWLLDGDPVLPLTGRLLERSPFPPHPTVSTYESYSLKAFDLAQTPTEESESARRRWSQLTCESALRTFEFLAFKAANHPDHAVLSWRLRQAVESLVATFPPDQFSQESK